MWRVLLMCAVTVGFADELSYTVAVVEYHPERNDSLTVKEMLEATTQDYLTYIERAANADIILFPESTLLSGGLELVSTIGGEVPKLYTDILCDSADNNDYMDYLRLFSCAAIEHDIVIVVNTVERENCTLNNSTGFCPASGVVYYNSDVAFDEKGYVSAKYRKWNLFGEYGKSPPAEVELVTITTKNNDTFGIFTCFDILFKNPALVLTQELGVRNILFPTMWFSELPYLTALQAQQMWSHENNVTFLSAGANNPSIGSGGTGIFIGEKGTLMHEMLPEPGSELFVKTVPRYDVEDATFDGFEGVEGDDVDALAEALDRFYLKVDSSIPSHSSIVLDLNKTEIEEHVCNGDVAETCCTFKMNITYEPDATKDKSYVYHLAAFNGIRTFSGVKTGGIELCSVIACLNESITSCGQRFPNYTEVYWPVTFQTLTISAVFQEDENRIQFPNSLLASLRSVPQQDITWVKDEADDLVERVLSLNRPQNRLLTFAIYGRDFGRDDMPLSNGPGKGLGVDKVMLGVTLFGIYLMMFL